MLPDESLGTVPVEVGRGVANAGEVDAGCEGVRDVRARGRERRE